MSTQKEWISKIDWNAENIDQAFGITDIDTENITEYIIENFGHDALLTYVLAILLNTLQDDYFDEFRDFLNLACCDELVETLQSNELTLKLAYTISVSEDLLYQLLKTTIFIDKYFKKDEELSDIIAVIVSILKEIGLEGV